MDHLPQDFCWVYKYEEEGRAGGPDNPLGPILRPVVPIQFVGIHGTTQLYVALVDSGASSILTPDWVAMELGLVLDDDRSTTIGLGGEARRVRYAHTQLRLVPPPDRADDEPLEWQTDVGFMSWDDPPWMVLLGQRGFFDTFTIVMSQFSQQLAVHRVCHFDDCYGVFYDLAPDERPGRTI